MELTQLKNIVEGALFAAGRPLDVSDLEALFDEEERPSRLEIGEALEEVAVACAGRGFELKKVASGYRFQVRQELSAWVSRLWEEKPQKYSRSLLETLALIAYRQPTTRGDIEEIRGVSVSSQTIKTLLEREWIRVVGHRDVPGRPALYATTRQFLDYFNLASLEDLPPLSELRDLEEIDPELELEIGEHLALSGTGDSASDAGEDSESSNDEPADQQDDSEIYNAVATDTDFVDEPIEQDKQEHQELDQNPDSEEMPQAAEGLETIEGTTDSGRESAEQPPASEIEDQGDNSGHAEEVKSEPGADV